KGWVEAHLSGMESIHADQFCGSLGRLLKSGIESSVIRSGTHLSCSILPVLRGLSNWFCEYSLGLQSATLSARRMSMKAFAALKAPVCPSLANRHATAELRVPWIRVTSMFLLFCL